MRSTTIVRSAAATLLVLLMAAPARAIPAFARKYQFSCSTCHAPVPKLKAFGEAFAARGFRLEDPSQEPTRAVIDTGDPTLRLLREFPFAVRIDGFASWKPDAPAETDVEWPWSLKFLSGAPISDSISYYFYGILEKGGNLALEDAFLQFSAPLKLPLDLVVGQFQVSDPLFKRELRLERYDYEIYKTRVGRAVVDLTYDRGLMVMSTLPGGLETVVQIVNGHGFQPADEEDNFDGDVLKNFGLRVAHALGGQGRVGVYGYWGKQKGDAADNRTWYFGPDLSVDLGERWQFNAQYLERRDDNPWFLDTHGSDVETRGGFAELHFYPLGRDGRWVLSGLYNNVDSDDPEAQSESISITANRLLARNIRLVLEAGREIERKAGRLTVGFVAAF